MLQEEDFSKYINNPLWPILVETAHAIIMYRYHKAYVKEKILPENSNITARELSAKMNIPLGEALVILYELKNDGSLKG